MSTPIKDLILLFFGFFIKLMKNTYILQVLVYNFDASGGRVHLVYFVRNNTTK